MTTANCLGGATAGNPNPPQDGNVLACSSCEAVKAELERWKMAAGEYYQAKENHRATLEAIRRNLNDPTLSDTAKVIRAQGALTGQVHSQERRTDA